MKLYSLTLAAVVVKKEKEINLRSAPNQVVASATVTLVIIPVNLHEWYFFVIFVALFSIFISFIL